VKGDREGRNGEAGENRQRRRTKHRWKRFDVGEGSRVESKKQGSLPPLPRRPAVLPDDPPSSLAPPAVGGALQQLHHLRSFLLRLLGESAVLRSSQTCRGRTGGDEGPDSSSRGSDRTSRGSSERRSGRSIVGAWLADFPWNDRSLREGRSFRRERSRSIFIRYCRSLLFPRPEASWVRRHSHSPKRGRREGSRDSNHKAGLAD
jgi:hypothetical protein